MLRLRLTPSFPPLPITQRDVPSYWWQLVTDLAIIATAIAAVGSIGFYWWSFKRSAHRVEIYAEVDKLKTIRIRVINTGRMPVEVKYVGLGTLYEKRGLRRRRGIIPLKYHSFTEVPQDFPASTLAPSAGTTWYFLWPEGLVEKRVESADGKSFIDWEPVSGPTDGRVYAAVVLHDEQFSTNVIQEPNDFLMYNVPLV